MSSPYASTLGNRYFDGFTVIKNIPPAAAKRKVYTLLSANAPSFLNLLDDLVVTAKKRSETHRNNNHNHIVQGVKKIDKGRRNIISTHTLRHKCNFL